MGGDAVGTLVLIVTSQQFVPSKPKLVYFYLFVYFAGPPGARRVVLPSTTPTTPGVEVGLVRSVLSSSETRLGETPGFRGGAWE